MAFIEISGLNKIYYSGPLPIPALQDINLNFEKQEFSAIVGPSGSGKTTLLNIIGGLDFPDSGQVSVNGQTLSELSGNSLIDFRLHHIGFVFQAYNLIPVFTALENVEFIMLLQGIKQRERQERAVQLLQAVGLDGKLNSRPSQLSGGQQQRVAVARALASRPDYVLADEPTANLDSVSAEALLDLMQDLNHRFAVTFLFSTHDQRVIRRARRVITLRDGQVCGDEIPV